MATELNGSAFGPSSSGERVESLEQSDSPDESAGSSECGNSEQSVGSNRECWKAFENNDLAEAIRLLPFVTEPTGISISYGATLLHLSSKNGWLDVTKDLVTNYKFDPQKKDNKGRISLLYTFADYAIDVLKYLINECNCNPMATSNQGNNILHYSATNGSLVVIKYLIDHYPHMNLMATNKIGETVLHCAVCHVDIVKYLVVDCICDPMSADNDGWTPLHFAANLGQFATAEYLLSTDKCDPLAEDNEGRTPYSLALSKSIEHPNMVSVFKKFNKMKISHPIGSYVNVLLLGNSGAGKSTLGHVITNTSTGSVVLGSFRNVKEVEPYTAGIIPTELQHKTLGNIILHDFAGHSEYYSSHSAVIENLLQGFGGVFVVVINMLEKEAIKQLHYWLTIAKNEAQKAHDQAHDRCYILVVASHVDKISGHIERSRIEEAVGSESLYFLDCRKLGGTSMVSFLNKLSSACENIRSTRENKLNPYHHEMYYLLEDMSENILTFSNLIDRVTVGCALPELTEEEIVDILNVLHSTGLINVIKSEDLIWIVVDKGILLSELNGILFAPKMFKEHTSIASNTGIVSVSSLTRLFPKYDSDMLICFLTNMELCQEINASFLRISNLFQLTVRDTEKDICPMKREEERLLFFPCLLYSDRPDEMISQVFKFGWCLQCNKEHDFFPPRCFHILSLHLAYKFALPHEDDILNRYCTFWRNGLHWFNGHGVGALVEIMHESQSILVMMSCEEGYGDNMVLLRREVIKEIMSVCKESCPYIEVKEFIIDPNDLSYPVEIIKERKIYNVHAVLSAITEGRKFLVTNDPMHRDLKIIIPDESFSDIGNLSLLGGRDINVRNLIS